MECVIQRSMFYSLYLFLSILLCNVVCALVSDSNAYIWISNCIQMFQLYSNIRIYIRMLKDCVFSTCSWKMASSNDVGKKISQFQQELVNAYKKKFRFLLWSEGESLCWGWRNARGFSWINVSKCDGGGVGGSKKTILAWRNYWIAPIALYIYENWYCCW